MKRLFLKAGVVAVAGGLLKACGGGGGGSGGDNTPNGSQTLLALAQRDGRFSHLVSAAERAGLTGVLGQAGSLTLFAPTNDAFNALAARIGLGDATGLINGLATDKLADLLKFHLVSRILTAADLRALGNPGGERPGSLYNYNGAPAELIFVNENNQLNLWDASGRTAITLADTDIAAANGVLHVVNEVLVPRGVLTVSRMVRANNESFSEFGAALNSTGLASTLDGAGPFTVFVPLDGTNTAALTANVVRHHIVPQLRGAANFPAVNASISLTPLAGSATTLTTRQGITRNGATVLAEMTHNSPTTAAVVDVDFYGTNGVIHTIDRTLLT